MANHEVYESPLVARYASREMSELFSERTRIRTWRRLWLALAKAEHRAGIRVTARQIKQLEKTIDRIDFAAAARHEKRLRHDVMAHLHAWGDIAPEARGIPCDRSARKSRRRAATMRFMCLLCRSSDPHRRERGGGTTHGA